MRTIGIFALGAVVVWGAAGCPTRCAGPDPKASSIGYELLEQTSDTSGTVRITGVVKNTGRSPFDSGPGQQIVGLYEEAVLVATEEFESLAVDETVEVAYERDWSVTDEFRPASYTVNIVYDPDIFIDGNPDNDDCNVNNNELTRSSAGLNALFD